MIAALIAVVYLLGGIVAIYKLWPIALDEWGTVDSPFDGLTLGFVMFTMAMFWPLVLPGHLIGRAIMNVANK